MPKYTDEVKANCVAKVKEGVPLTKISEEFGPNPKAIQRYCEKAGVEIPKQKRAKKSDDSAEEEVVEE